jgi:two-component system, LytTR family, response regulator
MIRSIVVDDEKANVALLSNMLKKHCPSVEITGSALSADDAYRLIEAQKPELLFLDVQMPGKTGFDLMRMFPQIDFRVIFVSGFNQYAIQAFEFNAIDYILKPISYKKLISAVDKVRQQIAINDHSNIIHFIDSLDEKTHFVKKVTLHHHDRVYIVEVQNIAYIHALRGYSEIVTAAGKKLTSSKSLTDYENLLSPYPGFLRLNKSILINIEYIKEYTKGRTCYIRLTNHDDEIEVSRRKKNTIIQYLKGDLS